METFSVVLVRGLKNNFDRSLGSENLFTFFQIYVSTSNFVSQSVKFSSSSNSREVINTAFNDLCRPSLSRFAVSVLYIGMVLIAHSKRSLLEIRIAQAGVCCLPGLFFYSPFLIQHTSSNEW